MQIVR